MLPKQDASFADFKKIRDITKKRMDEGNLSSLDEIVQELSRREIPYLIYLHANGFLEAIYSIAVNKSNSQKYECVPDLYSISIRVFPDFYEKIATNCIPAIKSLQQSSAYKNLFEESAKKEYKVAESNKKLQEILASFSELNQPLKDFNRLNKVIADVFKYKASDTYEEVTLNWVKKGLEELRSDDLYICCKVIFFKQERIHAIEGKSQEFKKYIWPIQSSNIKIHLMKTIIGYLNSSGGIIFIGIQENKQKKNDVVGISLENSKLREVYDFFVEIVGQIYPKHEGFNLPEKAKQIQKWEEEQIIVNDYFSMEFIPIVDKDTLLNVRLEHDQVFYIVKIIVKIGHPKHLYHYINTENMIDFFVRNNNTVEKKPWPEAHEMIYKRLQNYDKQMESEKPNFDRPRFHDSCRYEMNFTPIKDQ